MRKSGLVFRSLATKFAAGDYVKVVEVGPRDGLQNEKTLLSTEVKVELIDRLSAAGLPYIETTSFVSPKWVPQMANGLEVVKAIKRRPGVVYSAIVPNAKGFKSALEGNINEIAIGAAASETFCKKNWNFSIQEALDSSRGVLESAKKAGMTVRGYVSNVMGCPYEGDVPLAKVVDVCAKVYELGCSEVSLGDTIGVGTPNRFEQLLQDLSTVIPLSSVAVHCHDTYGQALPNILRSLELGVRAVDSSVAGLGGCPYAKGASGNVSTEDLVYLLDGLGLKTGVSLQAVAEIGEWICGHLGRANESKAGRALTKKD